MYQHTNHKALQALLEEQAEALRRTFGQAFAGLDSQGPHTTAENRRHSRRSTTEQGGPVLGSQETRRPSDECCSSAKQFCDNTRRPSQLPKNTVHFMTHTTESERHGSEPDRTQAKQACKEGPKRTPAPPPASFTDWMDAEFPDSVEMQVFLGQAQTVLRQRGFDQHTALPLVSVCRDEITRPFVETVDEIFGSSFSIASLAGFVFCGKTGFSAGFHHAPENADGVQRYVFFIGPHIAINEDGEVGVVWRKRQHHCSTACGALVGILGELQSGNLKVALDPTDLEQSLVRQQLVGALRYGQIPTLVEMTKVAREVIQRQVLNTLDSMSLDKCSYAVISFVQIHGPHDSQYIWPCDMFLSESGKPGERVDIRAEVLACKSCTALQHHQRMLAAKTMCVIADGDLEEVEDLIARAGDTDVQDVDGRTALHIACTEGKTDVVEYLLEENANVAVHDRWGAAPIDNAVLNGHLHIADRLLAHGAFLSDNVVAQQLILAASTGNEELAKVTLKFARPGAVNCADYAGRNALSIALSTNHLSLARLLTDNGARP